MCVCVRAIREAELPYNPEGISLSSLQIQLREMVEDGKDKGVKVLPPGKLKEKKKKNE